MNKEEYIKKQQTDFPEVFQRIGVLYEDSRVVVLDKPAGVMMHPDGRTEEPTLADWVIAHYPDTAKVGEPIIEASGNTLIKPGMVHRLDKDTSGVVVIARSMEAYQFLKRQFQEREVRKIYNAFAHGAFKEVAGEVHRPIGRSARDFRLFSAGRGARGTLREARTLWRVLAQSGGYAFLELEPKTGRTHQIRVHLKAINHPIVCDARYAPNHSPALGFSRLALHARSITLSLPNENGGGEERHFESPLPEDFMRARELLGE